MKDCNVTSCNGVHHAKGYCAKHYMKLKRFGDPLHGNSNMKLRGKMCALKGCTNNAQIKGLCRSHYHKQRRLFHGSYGVGTSNHIRTGTI